MREIKANLYVELGEALDIRGFSRNMIEAGYFH